MLIPHWIYSSIPLRVFSCLCVFILFLGVCLFSVWYCSTERSCPCLLERMYRDSLGHKLSIGIAESEVLCISAFLAIEKFLSWMVLPIILLSTGNKSSWLSPFLPVLVLSNFQLFCQFEGCSKVTSSFKFTFPISGFEDLFVYLLDIWIPSFVSFLFIVFVHLPLGVFFGSFYLMDINIFFFCMANIFSQFLVWF